MTGTAPLPGRDHWFWSAIRANRWSYGQVLLAAFMINLFSLAGSVFIMVVYDRIIPNNAVESLVALVAGMAIVVGFDFTLKMLRAYFIDHAGRDVDESVADTIFNRLMSVRLSSLPGSQGALANTVREFDSLREFFTSATMAAFVDLPFILFFLVVIGIIGGPLVVVPAIAVPLVLIIGTVIQPFLARISGEGYAQGRSKQAALVEMVGGIETLKTLPGSDLFAERWRNAVRNHSKVGMRSRLLSQLAVNSASTAQQLAQVVVVTYGVFLVMEGALTMGSLIATVIITNRCLAPLGQLANTLVRFNHARNAYQALDKLMNAPRDLAQTGGVLRRPNLKGRIEFRDVTFRYPGQSQKALDRVSFAIEPGEKVALLGKIGSGKSTIARLIAGLYEPEDGTILIDGTDVRQILREDLARNMGFVLQDAMLFSGTIKENITLGAADVNDEAVLKAARISGVDDFLGATPNGYDLRLADRGQGLSQGQRQSLAITRALVRDPNILILDEPSSAMDFNSERRLVSRLKESLDAETMVIITHRPAVLEMVDRILVLADGRVAAQGPKNDVLKLMTKGDRAMAGDQA